MMTSKERIQAVIDRRLPDRVPVCLHNFLMACGEADIPIGRYRSDAAAIVEAHLRALDTYRHDCILVDIDTTLLAEAMGARSAAAPGEPSHIAAPAINDLAGVARLRPLDPCRDGRVPVLLEAIHLLAEKVGKEISIRGNCDQAAFSLACLLRGNEEFLVDLMESPDDPAIADLLEVSHQSHLAVHRAVKAAGAHFTSMGDSFCGPDVVSPAIFSRYSRPYEERLVRELAEEGIFTLIHICGDTTLILDSLAEYPWCGFELDYKTDAARAKQTAGSNHVLFGNIDPSGVVARGTPNEVRDACEKLIATWKPGGGFVLNAGCAIPAGAPAENVHALVRSAAEFGVYG